MQLLDSVPLRAAFGRSMQSERPLTMEEAGQDFGYIHYQTTVEKGGKGRLVLRKLRDYAIVFVNGKRVGSLDRRFSQTGMMVDIPDGAKLEILVENVGRINYGPDLLDNHKGITESVSFCGKELKGWTTTPLPLYQLTKMPRCQAPEKCNHDMEGVLSTAVPSNSTSVATYSST